jgi:hypothetical protein
MRYDRLLSFLLSAMLASAFWATAPQGMIAAGTGPDIQAILTRIQGSGLPGTASMPSPASVDTPASAAVPAKPAASPARPLECEPKVIAAFKHIWGLSENGASSLEAGFRIDRAAAGVTIDFAPEMASDEVSIPVRPGVTLAIAHTHPDSVPSQPSFADRSSPLPSYIVTRDVLYVTDPATQGYRVVRYNWASPCR